MPARYWIRLAELTFAFLLALAVYFSWRADRRDRAQLNAELAATKQLLAAADARQHDRDAQLAQTLAALAAEKRTIVTPTQIARDLPSQVDAVAFTSQIQVRNLFIVAQQLGVADALVSALNNDVIVASVGPVCADALKQAGVAPDVQPAEPKMGPLLMALADYIELTEDTPDEG